MPELTVPEGILYSELIYRSLMVPEYFDENGKLNLETVAAFLRDKNEVIDCCKINVTRLAKDLETSNPAIRRSLNGLKEKFVLGSNFIRCPAEMVRQRYLTLPTGTKLKGRQLVFLAYLINRGKPHQGTIDTWEYKMAEDCNISPSNVSSIMHILYNRGFVERQEGGKIKIRESLTTSPDDSQNEF